MADFQFYLNRQGVRGAKGVKGDKGDSPIVSVNKHTADEYVLQINNPDGTQIITPNLVGQQIVVNTVGDYVKYDRDSSKFVTVELPSAASEEEGLIRLATDVNYTERDEFSAVTPYGLVKNLPSLITTSVDNLIKVLYDEPTDSIVLDTSKIHEDIDGVNTIATEALNISRDNTNEINVLKSTATSIDDNTTSANKVWSSNKTNSEISTVANELVQTQGDVAALDADMATKQNKLVQGNNITLTENDNGTVTISAAGGELPDNIVYTDTEQTITGSKIMSNGANLYGSGELAYSFIDSSGVKRTVSVIKNGVYFDIFDDALAFLDSSGNPIRKYITGYTPNIVAYNGMNITFQSSSANLTLRYRNLLGNITTLGNVIHTGNIMDNVAVDGQTIQVVDGKLHANLNEIGGEVSDISARVTTLEGQVGDISAVLDSINGEVI